MVEVKDFNARGDGMTNDTAAVQAALDCGEVVHFSPGTYMCGTLYMRSNSGFHLDEGAVLMAIPGKEHYNADDFTSRNRVFVREHTTGAHFIIAEDCENISFSGKGTISGNYKSVFDTTKTEPHSRLHYCYPEWRMSQMIFLLGCRNVKISGITMCDAQYWTCFLLDCEDAEISGVKVRCDRLVMNADGLDIDCCRHVKIENCDIDCGDDCIALRANESHAERVAPCEDIQVRNCRLRSPACAVRVGVGNGTLRNCILKDLEMYDCSIGIGFCPSYTAGKCVNVEDILFENVTFEGNQALLLIPYWGAVQDEDDPALKPMRNLTLRNFNGICSRSSLIAAPVEQGLFSGINLDNVTLTQRASDLKLSPLRWRCEENGVLNVFRMPELDTSKFRGLSEENLPAVLHRP